MKAKFLAVTAFVALAAMPALAQNKVKIGYINTFSGGLAVFGKHQKDAFELALDHLGRKAGGLEVEVIYGDDQAKPDVGKQVTDEFVNRHKVNFVAGITWSNVLAATQRSVLRSETIFITTNAGWSGMAGKECNPYFFSTSWNNDQTPEAMGKLLQDEGVEKVFAIAPNYQAGKDMVSGLSRYYKRELAGQILFKLGQTDFQAEISQIRAANPKAVFVFAPGPMGVAFFKQFVATGLNRTIPLYSVFTVDYVSLNGIGEAAVGTFHTSFWDPDSKNPANVRFIADFKKKYGYHPSMYSAQAYDAALLIDSAVKAVKGDLDDKKGMIAAMEKADFDSVRGKFTYNINHMPIQNFYKREVVKENGEVVIRTRGVVFENHKDAYYQDCKMAKP